MIVLNLNCHNGHTFEGWFASREAFEGQRVRGLVQCTHCLSEQVTALPSGPRVLRHSGHSHHEGAGQALSAQFAHSAPGPVASANLPAASAVQMPAAGATVEMAQRLYQALSAMARHAENVGDRFPEEARRIHYDEAPARTIRGIASADETQELLEEGILVLPAPAPADGELH